MKPKKNEIINMKRHLHSEQIGKLLMDSMIRYKNKWAAAGMALVLGAGSIGISFLYHPAVDETPTEQETEEETTAAASLAATPETETETVWIPTLDELNLLTTFQKGETPPISPKVLPDRYSTN